MNDLQIFKSSDNQVEINVQFENDTVWLTLNQLSELFEKDKSVISRHIRNIYEDQELTREATVAKNATVQLEAGRTVTRNIEHYNLDLIISLGYRVNSKRGTQFRQWATQRLKDYLVKGAAINQQRLEQLNQLVEIIERTKSDVQIEESETKGLLDILSKYTRSFILLNRYDSHSLSTDRLNDNITYEIQYNEAKFAIETLKEKLISNQEATALFGNEKDKSFEGTLKSVIQTFGGEYLYPTIEEQAAHLLYFVIKNHPFSDGNKRIGALLFVWFLDKNKHQFKKSGEAKINDNALTALALLIAQSNPNDKDLLVTLVCNLINE